MTPDDAPTLLWSGWALQMLDSLQAAVRVHRRALAASDSATIYVAPLARSLALVEERSEAEALLHGLESRATSGSYVPAYEIAKVHDALGRTDQAFARLAKPVVPDRGRGDGISRRAGKPPRVASVTAG